ncbi:hypothetical protein [Gloeocapsopsis sp. IPPAS B-1203]|uniref:hypothetical protein n=1 Tax=Gloeocapsopsis sp. IPPAS B-1203 TaxID=2049454 RepID=UPI000C183CD8|nr:hypothetical protein [Gloeocapsopsis sp. IPPAS B-1203]PIG93557.1 hypothetical protein CSQ79_11615 [Gloeocapsopsis sp. IPPAS B-1203]
MLALNSEAFEQINTLPYGSTVALVVVLAASLSQVVAQSVILFVNRVTPVRFVFTLLIGIVLFAFGYLFLVLSTWLISFAPFSVVARTLGFSYAPLIFSVFGAMPYLGEPILSVLSLWQLLAMVVGFAAASDTNVWQAFGTVALGWFTLWLMQRTIGQPIAQFGYWVACQVAGVELVTKRERLPAILQKRLRSFATNLTAVNTTINAVTFSSMQEEITSVRARSQYPTSNNSPSNAALAAQTDAIDRRRFQFSKILRQLPNILVLTGATFAAVVLLSPIRYWWFAWYGNLGGIFKLAFDLVWIGVIAFVASDRLWIKHLSARNYGGSLSYR